MTTTSFGDVHATGDDRRPTSGEPSVAGQPPITPGGGLFSTDWLPGPSDGVQSPVVVSFTDFHSNSDEDWQQIAQLGMKLAESWPIMRGAVGLWLWGKPAEWRGGSLHLGWQGRFASIHPLACSRRHHEQLAGTDTGAVRKLG
jgi:hypothetical protein